MREEKVVPRAFLSIPLLRDKEPVRTDGGEEWVNQRGG